MRTRLPVPVLVLVAATLAVAGCGGGSSKTMSGSANSTDTNSAATATTAPTTTTTSSTRTASTGSGSGKPLSRVVLIVRADAICKRLNAELDRTKNNISSQQDIVRIAPRRAAVEQTALTELGGLTPPNSMAADYQQMLATRQTLIEDIKKLGEDAATNNSGAESAVYSASTPLVHQMAAMALRDGFKYCGELG